MKSLEQVQEESSERLTRRTAEISNRKAALEAAQSGEEFDLKTVDEVERVAERATRLGMTAEAAALRADPDDQELGKRVLEQIIDANNLKGVMFLIKGVRAARAIGQILVPVTQGTRLGSGSMVTSRLLMTNNHVLESQADAAAGKVRFDYYRRENGDLGPTVEFALQPDRFFITNEDLDVTIVAVEDRNLQRQTIVSRGWHPLLGASGKAIVGERVNIIQHPEGKPQQIAIHDNKIVDVDGNWLRYETDTQGGSSGSPVFNDHWELAALHHAAVNLPGGQGKANEGARISQIVAWLQERFGNEAVTGDRRDLIAELLSADKPKPGPWSGHSDDRPLPPAPYLSQPSLRDGIASWVVPLNVSVSVGEAGLPGVSLTSPAGAVPAETPLLNEALLEFADARCRTYFDAAEDEAAREAYYPDNLQDLSGDDLFVRLTTLMNDTHHTVLSYDKARLKYLYPWIDLQEDSRQLRGIYSHKPFDPKEVIRTEAAMEAHREAALREFQMLESLGDHEAFLEGLEAKFPFNCEHVVPQSWFDKKKQMKTDLHHLFTCEWDCNSFRGKRAYFEFEEEALMDDCGESAVGKFEPLHSKAAVARATLYFLVHYPGELADSVKELPNDRVATLLEWHRSAPPDTWEKHRNAEIHKVQGNRNPFIDFPDLVDTIDFAKALV